MSNNNSLGLLYAFGRNNHGQLSIAGSCNNQTTPALVKYDGPSIRKISIGTNHCILVTFSGMLFTCGSNESAQLGHTESQISFQQVKTLETFNIVDAGAGGSHSVCISEGGNVFVWGQGDRGQLGLGRNRLFSDTGDDYKSFCSAKPRAVPMFSNGESKAVQICVGENHTMVLDSLGNIWTWGENKQGQLGLGHYVSSFEPHKIDSLFGVPVARIACGDNHCAALSITGRVYIWGQNEFNQLGLEASGSHPRPFLLGKPSILSSITEVALGGRHSLFLTRSSQVLSTGMGQDGQLGRYSNNSDSHDVPRIIAQLNERPISQISAGRDHSMVLSQSGRVYTFGKAICGQLGMEKLTDEPQTLRSLIDVKVSAIWAGSDSSFVLCSPDFSSIFVHPSFLAQNTIFGMIESAKMSDRYERLASDLYAGYSHMSLLNGSFLSKPSDVKQDGGIDLEGLRDTYAILYGKESPSIVSTAINRAIFELVNDLSNLPKDCTPDTLRCIPIIFENPYMLDSSNSLPILEKLISVVLRVCDFPSGILTRWWAKCPVSHFRVIVDVLQKLLSYIVMTQTVSERTLVATTLVLSLIHKINIEEERIPYTDFYNKEVSSLLNPVEAYHTWVSHPHVFSFCRFSFLLNADAKSKIVTVAAETEQHMETAQSIMRGFVLHEPISVAFVLSVRRESIFDDTMKSILSASPDEMRKRLTIVFEGEDAVDEGGVRKEFFQLLFHDIFTTCTDLFVYDEDSKYLWFNSGSPFAAEEHYQLLGTLFGLAIYNSVILEPFFPSVVYKKLLGHKGSLIDLRKVFPRIGKSLDQLLEYEAPDVETTFGLTFEVTFERNGEIITHSLKTEKEEGEGESSTNTNGRKRGADEIEMAAMDGLDRKGRNSVFDSVSLKGKRSMEVEEGSHDRFSSVSLPPPLTTSSSTYNLDEIPLESMASQTNGLGSSEGIAVTNANREEFVNLYVDWVMNKSIHKSFEAFQRGFLTVFHSRPLLLLRPEELELLVCGSPEFPSFVELEKHTRYEPPYSPSHPVIVAFWTVVHDFSVEMKRKLLIFVTASDRVPISGFDALRFMIRRTGDDSNRLPSAHTCFNILDLPEYNDKNILRERLVFALENTRGFGIV